MEATQYLPEGKARNLACLHVILYDRPTSIQQVSAFI